MSALLDGLSPSSIPGVTEVVQKIRSNLEKSFPFIWVRGEITDLSRSPVGHIYFSLKDDTSQLKCVWFSWRQKTGEQQFNPLTGEVYDENHPDLSLLLQNGVEIICAGSVSFYEPGGNCQLRIEFVELYGIGLLAQAFEALKNKLSSLGLFESSHKKILPQFPEKIALVTSANGAAIHDFIKIGKLRGLSSKIRLYPVPVQGAGAADKISDVLNLINRENWAQIIVLIRGGGSKEDLWCFNEEILAYAIYNSEIPVLTGIGHEVDQSLADLVADKSAATPSHAAQLLWPLRRELFQKIDFLEIRSQRNFQKILDKNQLVWKQAAKLLQSFSPVYIVNNGFADIGKLNHELMKAMKSFLTAKRQNLFISWRFLKNFNPADRILNEYFSCEKAETRLFNEINGIIANLSDGIDNLGCNVNRNITSYIQKKEFRLERLCALLEALNPAGMLKRGYALIYSEKLLVTSIKQITEGQSLKIRFMDGIVEVKTEKITPEE